MAALNFIWQLNTPITKAPRRTLGSESIFQYSGPMASANKSLKHRVFAATAFLALLGAIPLVFTGMTVVEHSRRSAILSSGNRVNALVIGSDDRGTKKLCKVRYVYEIGPTTFSGAVLSCDLMRRYPVGSNLPVRYDLNDPSRPLAEEETTWPAYSIVPILLLIPWSIVAIIIVVSLIKEALAQRRKRERQRNG